MKFLILLLTVTVMQKSCDDSNVNQNILSLEYSASSRKGYRLITINKKNITTVTSRGGKPVNKTCSPQAWNRLIKALSAVDVKTVSNLKAPSQDFMFDGAPMARLKLIYKGKTYETKPFDHGKPPEVLVDVIKEILSMSENIE